MNGAVDTVDTSESGLTGEFDGGALGQRSQVQDPVPRDIPEESEAFQKVVTKQWHKDQEAPTQVNLKWFLRDTVMIRLGADQGVSQARPGIQNQLQAGGYGRAGEQQALPRQNPYIEPHRRNMTLAESLGQDYPSLCSKARMTQFATMCPVRALIEITVKALLKKSFLSSINGGKKFTEYLQELNGVSSSIAPYALRIGGRTWLISNGLDRQLVDYLGTWKSHEASARYYRCAPELSYTYGVNSTLTYASEKKMYNNIG